MSADAPISRRAVLGGLMILGAGRRRALAQGFAGLESDATGFAPVVAGRTLSFPADHGPHPEFRIEWWYVTANLNDKAGNAYGAQWTLFRQALAAGPQQDGWASQQFWMGHAAVTRADRHRAGETFGRGGVGQAGVELQPFQAWIDSWQMRGLDGWSERTVAPLQLTASGADFSYQLRLESDRALVLEGDAGYSRKSERGQASYYYSQPFFTAAGVLTMGDTAVDVSGQAWMDREWSSQPLASDQTGWDWFGLHLASGEKLMLFRQRQRDGQHYVSGNWIDRDGRSAELHGADIALTPVASTAIAGRELPTAWRITIAAHGVGIETAALNPASWMATSLPYWEGPIHFAGSHRGVGYLELTGY